MQKLTIRSRQLENLPVLEVVPTAFNNAPLPLIIFYHGWRNNKELMLTQARRAAQRGFRVILPDTMNHGQRKAAPKSVIPSLTFWTSIQYNLIEFEQIIQYFNQRQLILDGRIGVGGYSMGGITTAALLTLYPEIKVAASIMGTPQPAAYFARISNYLTEQQKPLPRSFPLIFDWLKAVDLSLQPEKMAGRPILLWHGTEDPKIPYQQVQDFYQATHLLPAAQGLEFMTGQGEGHLVTIDLMETIATHFETHL